MRNILFIACFGVIFLFTSNCLSRDFPYRSDFPEIKIIELADFKSDYDQEKIIPVDLRSETEFKAIHIQDAVNIPFAEFRFMRELKKLAAKNPDKRIVVYDNGVNCLKSYKAAEEAFLEGIAQIYAYDGGVGAWAKSYPANTLLLGKKLITPDSTIISDARLKEKNLDFETFKRMATGNNSVVIDVRDPIQRQQDLPGMKKVLNVSADKLVQNIIINGHMKDKKMLVFDQVGSRVKWLMYYLVDNGYVNYYFLEGGATAVLKTQDYRIANRF